MKLATCLFTLATLLLAVGCSTLKPKPSTAAMPPAPALETESVCIEGSLAAGPVRHVENRDDPAEVVAFARSLSAAGRHIEAAAIYQDAAYRFESVGGRFETDCRKAAVREYWLAGELERARTLLDRIQADQDLYSRVAEADSLRQLRQLLATTN